MLDTLVVVVVVAQVNVRCFANVEEAKIAMCCVKFRLRSLFTMKTPIYLCQPFIDTREPFPSELISIDT